MTARFITRTMFEQTAEEPQPHTYETQRINIQIPNNQPQQRQQNQTQRINTQQIAATTIPITCEEEGEDDCEDGDFT